MNAVGYIDSNTRNDSSNSLVLLVRTCCNINKEESNRMNGKLLDANLTI